jgi:hypothetical protein
MDLEMEEKTPPLGAPIERDTATSINGEGEWLQAYRAKRSRAARVKP